MEPARRLADLPVRHVLVVQPDGLGRAGVLARPPTADLDIVGLAGPVGYLVRRDVGQVEQPLADPFPGRLGRRRHLALLVAEEATLLAGLLGPCLVARPLGLTHGATERPDLGPDGLETRLAGPMGLVGVEQRVDFRRIHAPACQCRLDPLGIFAQHADIDHACSK
jgi:hypothetical protein